MNSLNSYDPYIGRDNKNKQIYPQNQNNLQSSNNIYDAFRPNTNLVGMRNFKNNNDLLVNNLEPDVLNQDIFEITVQIDSTDRDTRVYPNPFDMKITFNPISDARDRRTGQLFEGTPGPTIQIDFNYVKYIKLENAVLPRNCYIKQNFYNDEKIDLVDRMVWGYDNNRKLNEERFLLMDIEEIPDDSMYGTNSAINKSFGLIYCDKIISPDFYTGTTFSSIKIFPSSNLGCIKTWTIHLMDSRGKQLVIDNIDKKCDTPGHCICKMSKYTKKQKEKCVCKYIKHPLNPKFQVFLTFKIGILRNELNINPLKN